MRSDTRRYGEVRILTLSLLCVFGLTRCAGCDEEDSDAFTDDASSERETDAGLDASESDSESSPELPCELAFKPPAEGSLTEGGLITLRVSGPVLEGSIALRAPSDWVSESLEFESDPERPGASAAVAIYRAPYGIQGAQEITANGICAGGVEARGSIELEVRPWRWRRAASSVGPSARQHPAFYIDPARPDELWVFGGLGFIPRQFDPEPDVWKFDLVEATWERVGIETPGPEYAAWRALPGAGGGVRLFGGVDVLRSAFAPSFYDVTPWESPLSWEQGPGAPLPLMLGMVLWDAPRERYVAACGTSIGAGGSEIDCTPHVWDPEMNSWMSDEGGAPSALEPRYGVLYAHDTDRERALVFSGSSYPTQADRLNAREGVWALDLSQQWPSWSQLDERGETPAPRRNGCSGWDAASRRWFIWGGVSAGGISPVTMRAFHVDEDGRAGTWHQVPVEGEAPGGRSACGSIFDAGRGEFLVGFGSSSEVVYDDLWALSSATGSSESETNDSSL